MTEPQAPIATFTLGKVEYFIGDYGGPGDVARYIDCRPRAYSVQYEPGEVAALLRQRGKTFVRLCRFRSKILLVS